MTNQDSILKKQRHHFANKGLYSQSNSFSSSHVWIESRTIKKVEHQKIDALELWFWGKLLRVSQTAKRSNQSIPKEISPEYSLEGLKLKLQYFDHLMQRTYWLENPDAGKDWRKEEKGITVVRVVGWHHRLNGHEFEETLGDGEGQGILTCSSSWGRKELNTTEWLNNNKKQFYTMVALEMTQ